MTAATTSQRRFPAWLWPESGWPPLLVPALVLVIQVVGTTFAAEGQTDRESLDVFGYALLAAGPLALVARHRYPYFALAAVTAVTLTYMLAGYPYGPVILSFIVVIYSAVMDGYRLGAWVATGALYGLHFGARSLFGFETEPSLEEMLVIAGWLLLFLAASEVARARRDSELETRRVREEEERTRASEERLRIARELHDVLAHHISLINVQSGVALHLMDRQPEQARTALAAIEGASREALAELRSVLNILRRPEEAAPRAPSAGLARLETLTSQARAAGLEVQTRIEGTPRTLPAPVDAAAFRIVQEALTNVIRHAGAHAASVSIRYGEGDVAVEVEDDGEGAATLGSPAGSGIAGMRDRVTALGGQFEAGALPQRGFRVRALLPLEAPA